MDFMSLIPSFGNLAVTILAFVVALVMIVGVHEFGHYIVGRWSGIKADVFSIGAGPVLASRVDRHGTRWQVAALPIGGYVKFHGDSNASSSGAADEEAIAQMSPEELRTTMHGAPLWARSATVVAGPFINFLFSVLIFTALAFTQGVASDPLTVAEPKPLTGVVGVLMPGDEVLAIAGMDAPDLEDFGDYADKLPDRSPLDWTLRRDGAEITVSTLHPYPALVGLVVPQSAASDAGLQPGDLIVAVNGENVGTFNQMKARIEGGEGAPVRLSVERGGAVHEVTLKPRRMDEPQPDGGYVTNWRIGVGGGLSFEPATRTPGPGQALLSGIDRVRYLISTSVSAVYHMVAGKISSCNMRGVITMAETSGEAASQGFATFLSFVAVLSTAIGFLNLFPIPVLDGGHLLFHAYEAIVRRPPPDRALNLLTLIGLVVVVSLMVFGLSNDIFCE
ncbi:MAG: RIP metalloprotease RseP [Rhodobacterales bacterium]|nr:MAG: RIP metalloprotease RseP [Rhodobacterales bacterium]